MIIFMRIKMSCGDAKKFDEQFLRERFDGWQDGDFVVMFFDEAATDGFGRSDAKGVGGGEDGKHVLWLQILGDLVTA